MTLFGSCRFDVSPRRKICLQGQQYRLGRVGQRSLVLLAAIYDAPDRRPNDLCWLIRHRSQLREIIALRPVVALIDIACDPNDPALQRLAVWLRGRCGGSLGTKTIAELAYNADRALRKEVAHALRRMQAWPELHDIEVTDPDQRIRTIACQSGSPFSDRLLRFRGQSTESSIRHNPQPLFVSDEVDFQGKPPKSRWLIRVFLASIRRWLRG